MAGENTQQGITQSRPSAAACPNHLPPTKLLACLQVNCPPTNLPVALEAAAGRRRPVAGAVAADMAAQEVGLAGATFAGAGGVGSASKHAVGPWLPYLRANSQARIMKSASSCADT